MKKAVSMAFALATVSMAVLSTAPSTNAQSSTLLVPASSVVNASDQGLRAHTNVIALIQPNASSPSGSSETPASIACVYGLVQQVPGCPISVASLNPSGGVGAIAIVDAYDDPTAASDLSVFSNKFGISPANFEVVYASGSQPAQDPTGGWELEESLDVQWAHAMSPAAKLYLVEAASNSYSDLFTAVRVASGLVSSAGGGAVSMSWGGSEFNTETSYDSSFETQNIFYVASTGDSAFAIEYPAVSPYVVAAGGTSLQRNSAGDFTGEVYWDDADGGGGGGLSVYESRPLFQSVISSIVGSRRGVPDISSDADPVSGVAVYDSGVPLNGATADWIQVGGTSVAAPTLASRLVNAQIYTGSEVLLGDLYGEYANAQEYAADFRDITQGNSQCVIGWDFCSGIGAPIEETEDFTASPTSINFGSYSGDLVCAGDTATYPVTISNNTYDTFDLLRAVLQSKTGGGFILLSNSCGSTLAPGAACTVQLQFDTAFASYGSNTAALTASASYANSVYSLSVPLSGNVNFNCTKK